MDGWVVVVEELTDVVVELVVLDDVVVEVDALDDVVVELDDLDDVVVEPDDLDDVVFVVRRLVAFDLDVSMPPSPEPFSFAPLEIVATHDSPACSPQLSPCVLVAFSSWLSGTCCSSQFKTQVAPFFVTPVRCASARRAV